MNNLKLGRLLIFWAIFTFFFIGSQYLKIVFYKNDLFHNIYEINLTSIFAASLAGGAFTLLFCKLSPVFDDDIKYYEAIKYLSILLIILGGLIPIVIYFTSTTDQLHKHMKDYSMSVGALNIILIIFSLIYLLKNKVRNK